MRTVGVSATNWPACQVKPCQDLLQAAGIWPLFSRQHPQQANKRGRLVGGCNLWGRGTWISGSGPAPLLAGCRLCGVSFTFQSPDDGSTESYCRTGQQTHEGEERSEERRQVVVQVMCHGLTPSGKIFDSSSPLGPTAAAHPLSIQAIL